MNIFRSFSFYSVFPTVSQIFFVHLATKLDIVCTSSLLFKCQTVANKKNIIIKLFRIIWPNIQ